MAVNINGTGSITGLSSISSPTISGGSLPAGTASAPGITFSGDSNTGIYSPGADKVAITTNGTERLIVDDTGNVGIGTTSPEALTHIQGTSSGGRLDCLRLTNNATAAGTETAIIFENTTGTFEHASIVATREGSGTLNFEVAEQERARIDSSGRLLVGTSSTSDNSLIQIQGRASLSTGPAEFALRKGALPSSGDTIASIKFQDNSGNLGGLIAAIADANWTSGSSHGTRVTFSTCASGASSPTERMIIASGGAVNIGTTTPTSTSYINVSTDGGTVGYFNRNSSDGTLIEFRRAGSPVGTISVSGGTVSYNPFLGSHWARLEDDSKPEILIGTILETVNKLIDWRVAKFSVSGKEKIAAYHGAANIGDTVQVEYEGVSYDAIVSLEEDPTNSINKHVCVKVSDTPASSAVYGVFLGWDEDPIKEMITSWNDLYCAAVGNYFIRIAAGQTVAIGDLIESDGNGCGVVQNDDIVRSKTVGKVTSTIPQETYNDGSFLVTCVLCCG